MQLAYSPDLAPRCHSGVIVPKENAAAIMQRRLPMTSRAGAAARSGTPVPDAWPLPIGAAGRPLTSLPDGTYPALRGDLWVLATRSPRSWDSRYFGPVPASGVRGILHPLWVIASASGR